MAEGFPSTALCCQHQAGIFRSTNRPWASSPCGITLPECLGNPHPQSWTWIFVFSQKLWTWFLTWLLYFFFLKGNPLICGFKVISEGVGALLVYKAVSAVAFIRWVIGGGAWPTSIVRSRQGSDMSSNINELCQEGDIELIKLILSFGLPLPRLLPIPSRFFRPKSQILNWD